MSKHWRPTDVLRPDFRRRLGHWPRQPRWAPLALLGGAALGGAAIGLGEGLLAPDASVAAGPPIEWNAVQAMPTPALAAEDRDWQEGAADVVGSDRRSVVQASGRRAAFGFCHSGGGTDCVVDGDTIRLGGEKIRVADIDAPETHPPRCAEEARLGNQATRRLQQLLNGGTVSLQAIDRDEDRYGRKLRVVLVDGRSVGEALIGEGLARSYEGGRRPWC